MGAKSQKKRDREITREIHRLFWKANLQRPFHIISCYLLRFPAFWLVHITMPLYIAYAIEAIINKNFAAVPGYAWQLVIISIVFGLLWTIAGLIIPLNGVKGGAYLQRKVFANFLSKDYDFYTNTYFGSLGAQAMQLREAYNNQYNIIFFNEIPRTLVIVFGGIIVIAAHSVSLALVTLVAMSAVLGFTIFSGRWRLKWRRIVSEENSNLAGKIGDALTHAPAVKSFAAEDYEERRILGNLRIWERAQYISWALNTPADTGRYFLVACATALLLVMTASMYQDGIISIAIVTVVQLYVIKMIAATVTIGEIIKTYEQAMGSAYQPIRTMMIEPTVTDTAKPIKLPKQKKYSVAFENVTYKYDNTSDSAVAIKNFDLEVKPGEKVGLVGYSGSGKTTLTKLLLRFMDIQEGTISVAGTDIKSVAQKDLRKHIAYVPQEPILFHRSVFENIAYGRPEAGDKAVRSAAKLAYVDEFVDDLPERYDTLVGERGVKLSGGQRQRVAIARAILKDAPILVLDEATSALDSRSEQLIQKALWRLMKDRTALVIAHRLSTIQRMDRIVVMDKGKVVQVGTHQQLLKDKKGIYAELWAHQSGGYIGLPTEEETAE
jgi:ATP-binding cassette, subfamily B, bacterial